MEANSGMDIQCDENESKLSESGSYVSENSAQELNSTTQRDEKPYSCSMCKCSFTDDCNLEYHISIHNSPKPFHCEICKLVFTHRSQLQRHMRVHTGEKTFPVSCVQHKICS